MHEGGSGGGEGADEVLGVGCRAQQGVDVLAGQLERLGHRDPGAAADAAAVQAIFLNNYSVFSYRALGTDFCIVTIACPLILGVCSKRS